MRSWSAVVLTVRPAAWAASWRSPPPGSSAALVEQAASPASRGVRTSAASSRVRDRGRDVVDIIFSLRGGWSEDLVEERTGAGVLRAVEDLGGRALLDDPAA